MPQKSCPFRISTSGPRECLADACMAYITEGDGVRCMMMVNTVGIKPTLDASVSSSKPEVAYASMVDLNTLCDDLERVRKESFDNGIQLQEAIKEDRKENKQLFDAIEKFLQRHDKNISDLKDFVSAMSNQIDVLKATVGKPAKGKKVTED